MIKRILIVLFAILGIAQFLPHKKPEIISVNPNDLITNGKVSAEIQTLLKTSCYDCHSNQTNYPWYTYVVPVSYLIERDVREGREKLNFSEWQNLSKMDKLEKLDDMSDALESNEMPLKIYTFMHHDATLSPKQRNQLASWTEDYAEIVFEE